MKPIEIYKSTKVFVMSPGSGKTGGIELLHQITDAFKTHMEIESYMYYYPLLSKEPQNEYKKYNISIADHIEDSYLNILIIPEVYINLEFLKNFNHIRFVIWWLSIDNYFSMHPFFKKYFFYYRLINKITNKIFGFPVYDIPALLQKKIKNLGHLLKNEFLVNKVCCHLTQSTYAKNYLIKTGIFKDTIKELSDYLNVSFLKETFKVEEKENVVVFNPKKGIVFTKKIMKQASNIKFVPLISMSRMQVIETLKKAKVYIDFGNHPGKDRIPREAAIMGCCVITGKRGSAAYFEDVPIPEKYKFEDKKENIPKIIERIRDCLENYNERYKDFDNYREIIRKEPEKFVEDMKKIFVKVL